MARATKADVGRARPLSAGGLLLSGVKAAAAGEDGTTPCAVGLDVAVPKPVSVGASAVGEVAEKPAGAAVGDVAVEAARLIL